MGVGVALKSGISQARSRLGAEPLRRLYTGLVGPIAEKRTKGAWYRDWRLVSLEGSWLDVADTKENEKAYGRPGALSGSVNEYSGEFESVQVCPSLKRAVNEPVYEEEMSELRIDARGFLALDLPATHNLGVRVRHVPPFQPAR